MLCLAVTIFPPHTTGGIKPTIYFDTSAIIIVLILLGKYFEVLMKATSEAIKNLLVYNLRPPKFKEPEEIEILISEVQVGDIIIVRPGKNPS